METEKQENGQIELAPAVTIPKKRTRRKPFHPVKGTPDEVVMVAIERGADPTQLKELLELQLRWERHQAEKAYQEEFLAFKQEPELKILRDELVEYETRDGSTKKYFFSPLDRAEEVLIPLLAKHKITHHWRLEPLPNNDVKVTCVLKHVLCYTNEDACLQGPPDATGKKNFHQAIGSNTSYLERYTLFAACGITPRNVDNDARVPDASAPARVNGGNGGNGGNGQNLVSLLEPAVKQALEAKARACKNREQLNDLWSAMNEQQREGLRAVFNQRRIELREAACK